MKLIWPAPTLVARRAMVRRAIAVCMHVAGATLLGASAQAQVQTPTPTVAGIKAVYLYKFLPYIEWPANTLGAADASLIVGIVGSEQVLLELQAVVAGRKMNGRSVVVRRVVGDDELAGLHVLFIGSGASATRWLDLTKSTPVLVVTETPQGLDAGAMMNFVLSDGRVRFEAAPSTAERHGLKLGARLLAVAEKVVAK